MDTEKYNKSCEMSIAVDAPLSRSVPMRPPICAICPVIMPFALSDPWGAIMPFMYWPCPGTMPTYITRYNGRKEVSG